MQFESLGDCCKLTKCCHVSAHPPARALGPPGLGGRAVGKAARGGGSGTAGTGEPERGTQYTAGVLRSARRAVGWNSCRPENVLLPPHKIPVGGEFEERSLEPFFLYGQKVGPLRRMLVKRSKREVLRGDD